MRLSDIARWGDGQLLGADGAATTLVIDSRKVQAGSVFLALRGEQFDGHDFIPQAVAAGAVAVVTEQEATVSCPVIQVQDSRRALGLIARGWYQQFAMPSIAVTGNAGKTSVKEMIAALLGADALATQGNFNNDIGVPLTLLRATSAHDCGVFELGANHLGEIAWTVSLVQPDVALITNVTGAHLEGFGSMQGIANAKAEIFQGVHAGGTAVINLDDGFCQFFREQAQQNGLRVVTASATQVADFSASDYVATADGSQFQLHHQGEAYAVSLALPGEHQVINALQAIAAVDALGVDVVARLSRLASLQPVAGRMVVHACANGQLVDDTYNANPGSVLAAGRWLASQSAPRLFVFGGVGELGETSEALHHQMGEQLKQLGVDRLITVGPLATASATGFGAGALAVAERGEAIETVVEILAAGGSVLVKGSRSTVMEKLVDAVLQRAQLPRKEAN